MGTLANSAQCCISSVSAPFAKIKITLTDRDTPFRGSVVTKVVETCDPTTLLYQI